MRVIAAITIFFLPATFTATFFSTTFFSFNSDLGGRVYSKWLWLYFVVSIVLTTVVVVGTWLLWKGKEKEISRQSGKIIPDKQQYAEIPISQPPALIAEMQNYVRHEIGASPINHPSRGP